MQRFAYHDGEALQLEVARRYFHSVSADLIIIAATARSNSSRHSTHKPHPCRLLILTPENTGPQAIRKTITH